MALTQAQLNAHLRTMLLNQIQHEEDNFAVLKFFLRACERHARAGNGDNAEAARTVGQAVFENVIGRSATADDLHYLRNHLAGDVDGAGIL